MGVLDRSGELGLHVGRAILTRGVHLAVHTDRQVGVGLRFVLQHAPVGRAQLGFVDGCLGLGPSIGCAGLTHDLAIVFLEFPFKDVLDVGDLTGDESRPLVPDDVHVAEGRGTRKLGPERQRKGRGGQEWHAFREPRTSRSPCSQPSTAWMSSHSRIHRVRVWRVSATQV